jgi:arabinofuranosyltransferase
MAAESREHRYTAAFVVSALLLLLLVRTAWMSDDAYLTFRTVDNWLHGYGLRWNPLERVQAFSHPLWLLLVAAGYALTRETYYTVLALSALLTLATARTLVCRIAHDTAAALGGAAILLLSKSFIDYSTSGLEHPLVHLLLALFFASYFGATAGSVRLAWLAGLLAVTRVDAVLLVAPALVAVVWSERHTVSIRRVLAAALPLLAWEVFATIYYGFPFPNAAVAWATAAPSLSGLVNQGAVYLFDSINLDPITLTAMAVAVTLAVSGAMAEARPLALGIGLYLLMVVVTGGDVASGRELSAPLLCAAIAVSRLDSLVMPTYARAHALGLLVLLGLMAPRSNLLPAALPAVPGPTVLIVNDRTGIADARLVTEPATGLMHAVRDEPWPNTMAVRGGAAARDAHRAVVTSGGDLNPAAFFAGPTVHIIDRTGVADPLLARLPPEDMVYAGAAIRDVPDGYEATVASSENQLTDPALATFYDRLRLITRGHIWSGRRWRDIARMNFTADGVRPKESSGGARAGESIR